MGNLQVRYPFVNDTNLVYSSLYGNFSDDARCQTLFKGENAIGDRYGSYTFSSDSRYIGGGGCVVSYTAPFIKFGNFKWYMNYANASAGFLSLSRNKNDELVNSGTTTLNTMYYYSTANGDGMYGRDYTKVPFYSCETESTYLFAVDKLCNFFMITERYKIDDRSVKNVSIFTRKITGESDSCPLGFYEFTDDVPNSDCTMRTNLYTENNFYNAHNVGYCSKYSLYQYTRNGYIYPDVYYCDGGLSIPPDGIVRIGTSSFMKLGANLFLRVD